MNRHARLVVGLTALASAISLCVPASGQESPIADASGATARLVSTTTTSLLDRPARLSLDRVPLLSALTELRNRSGVPVVYSEDFLPHSAVVSCECGSLSVGESLDRILAGTSLRYVAMRTQVVIEPLPRGAAASPLRSASRDAIPPAARALVSSIPRSPPGGGAALRLAGTISGRVLEANTRRPLSGAQVSIPGTRLGTLSNNAGQFMLVNVPAGPTTIRAQMIGHGTEERQVEVADGQTVTIDFALSQQAVALDEVVVTGTAGATQRRRVGNTLATVNAGDLVEEAPVMNFTELIQGRAAGVSMLPSGGTVGTGGSIRIRGMTSVTQSNSPLIYIDGVRMDASSVGAGVGGQEPSRLTDLNPNDIERIEIVKGAAATTLYGTQGSNGVIQIFTKRGRSGAPQWTLDIEQAAERLDPGKMPGRLWTEFVGPDGFRAHDPREIIRTGHHQTYSLSVNGGDESLRYFLSGTYLSQEGSVNPDVNWLRQLSTRLNVDVDLHPTLSLSLNVGYTNPLLRLPDNDNALHGVYSQVVSGVPYTATADRPWGERWGSHEINQTVETYQDVQRFVGGFTLEHAPLENLRQTLTVGLDWYGQEDKRYFPYGFRGSGNNLGAISVWQRRFNDLTVDYRALLSNELRSGITSEFAAGLQGNFTNSVRTLAEGRDFPAPGVTTVSAAAVTLADETRMEEVNAGFFLQETLGLGDRLFLTGGMRLDGNSAFGDEFPFKAYPKVSVAYTISDEAFWPARLISSLKLRGAYGTAGRAPAQFAADRTFSPIPSEDGQPAVTPWNVGDPNLGPETSHELELGVDAGIWENRIGLELTYYTQRTRDALVQRQYPPSEGFDRLQLANIGEIRNSGYEATLRALLITRPSLDWDAQLQLSTQENEVVDLGGTPPFSGGSSTRVVEGFPVLGKWTRALERWDPVERKHYATDTLVHRGHADPSFRGSLSTSMRFFNNLTISAMTDWATGHHQVNQARGWAIGKLTGDEYLALLERPRGTPTAASDSLLNLWEAIGNTGWVERADFLKLREISLSYQLPDRFLSRFGLARTSIRIAGRNLYTYAPHWTGPDPEVNYQGHSDLARGLDFNTMPPARRFSIAFRTTF